MRFYSYGDLHWQSIILLKILSIHGGGKSKRGTSKFISSAGLHFPVADIFYFTNLLVINAELMNINITCSDHSRR